MTNTADKLLHTIAPYLRAAVAVAEQNARDAERARHTATAEQLDRVERAARIALPYIDNEAAYKRLRLALKSIDPNIA